MQPILEKMLSISPQAGELSIKTRKRRSYLTRSQPEGGFLIGDYGLEGS